MGKNSNLNENEIICINCGAKLKFAPGTNSLVCEYCGAENKIAVDLSKMTDAHKEFDFNSYLSNATDLDNQISIETIACNSCGAQISMDENTVIDDCSFCGATLENKSANEQRLIKPQALLPFNIKKKQGSDLFRNWLKKLWWAPNDLKKRVRDIDKLQGIYVPYWTYDSQTNSYYTGARGEHYYETESYTDSDGNSRQRQVQKTRWYNVSGRLSRFFNDVLVVASNSLPSKLFDRLAPWDLNALLPYDPKFMTGFRAEAYQIDLKEGFEIAKRKIYNAVRQDVINDIGGDEQRINSLNIDYSAITFKHVLLPIWISAYRYKDKVYRFVVNGRTGKVSGERPYSWVKITLAIITALAVAGGIYYITQNS